MLAFLLVLPLTYSQEALADFDTEYVKRRGFDIIYIITHVKFCINRFRCFGVLTLPILPFSVYLIGPPYNTVSTIVLYCEAFYAKNAFLRCRPIKPLPACLRVYKGRSCQSNLTKGRIAVAHGRYSLQFTMGLLSPIKTALS